MWEEALIDVKSVRQFIKYVDLLREFSEWDTELEGAFEHIDREAKREGVSSYVYVFKLISGGKESVEEYFRRLLNE